MYTNVKQILKLLRSVYNKYKAMFNNIENIIKQKHTYFDSDISAKKPKLILGQVALDHSFVQTNYNSKNNKNTTTQY